MSSIEDGKFKVPDTPAEPDLEGKTDIDAIIAGTDATGEVNASYTGNIRGEINKRLGKIIDALAWLKNEIEGFPSGPEKASQTEANTGTDDAKYMTPNKVKKVVYDAGFALSVTGHTFEILENKRYPGNTFKLKFKKTNVGLVSITVQLNKNIIPLGAVFFNHSNNTTSYPNIQNEISNELSVLHFDINDEFTIYGIIID